MDFKITKKDIILVGAAIGVTLLALYVFRKKPSAPAPAVVSKGSGTASVKNNEDIASASTASAPKVNATGVEEVDVMEEISSVDVTTAPEPVADIPHKPPRIPVYIVVAAKDDLRVTTGISSGEAEEVKKGEIIGIISLPTYERGKLMTPDFPMMVHFGLVLDEKQLNAKENMEIEHDESKPAVRALPVRYVRKSDLLLQSKIYNKDDGYQDD